MRIPKNRGEFGRKAPWLALLAAGTATAVVGGLWIHGVWAGSEKQEEAAAAGITVPQASAQWVYLDENGQRVVPPPGTAKSLASPAVSRISDGEEYPNPGPGGGMASDLKGRFRTYSVATKAPDGTVRIDHVQGADRAQAMVEQHRNGNAAPLPETEE